MSNNAVTCWRYALPNTGHYEGWAVVHVDSEGFLGIASDYGDYVYQWPGRKNAGGDFRRFLVALNAEDDQNYLMSKLSRRDVLDRKGTAENVREAVREMRRDGSLTKEEARECWNAAQRFEDDDEYLEHDLWDDILAIEDCEDLFAMTYSDQLKAFVRKEWPRIVAAIREDLAQEDGVSA